MTDPRNPIDIWQVLFEQTPLVLRWVLGMLTLGIFTLAGVLYRMHRDDLQHINTRIDRLERVMDSRHQETNRILLQIAQNTSKGGDK